MEKLKIRLSRQYFVCKSIDVLSKLMQRGFFPVAIKKSDKENIWIWYFDTTKPLIEVLKQIFPFHDVVVVDD